jgi:hypothetical protein
LVQVYLKMAITVETCRNIMKYYLFILTSYKIKVKLKYLEVIVPLLYLTVIKYISALYLQKTFKLQHTNPILK